MSSLRENTYRLLRWSERYTKTDMVYLVSGSSWLILGQIVSTIASLLLAVAFGHLASQDSYGNYKYILTVAGLLGIISLSGLNTSLTQSVARGYEGSLHQAFRLNVRWSGPMVAVAGVIAGYYFFFQHNAFLAAALVVIGVCLPFLNGFVLYSSYLIGKKEFKRDTVYNILDGILPNLLLIGVLFVSTRAIVMVIAYFLANTVFTGIFYFLSLKRAKNAAEDPTLLGYSAHLSVMNVISAIADKIDSVVIFAFLGPAHLAVYSYAIAVPEQIKAFVKMITPLSLAKFSERSVDDIQKGIWGKVGYFTATIVLVVIVYIAAAPFLFHILFPVYTESVVYSQIFAVSLIFGLTTPFASVFQAHKKTRELYITANVTSILLIVLLPILTSLYGIAGAIASVMIYRAFTMLLTIGLFLNLVRKKRSTLPL